MLPNKTHLPEIRGARAQEPTDDSETGINMRQRHFSREEVLERINTMQQPYSSLV